MGHVYIDLPILEIRGAHVHGAAHDLPGVKLAHELDAPLQSELCVHRLHALDEPGRGVGHVLQLPGGMADVAGLEGGGLEEHGLGVLRDLTVQAAHDAGHAYAALGIADEEHVLVHDPLLLVQRHHLLALLSVPDDDVPVPDAGKVEGVGGMAVLHQHVVGDVHDVADGPHAHLLEPPLHPGGGGADLKVRGRPARIPGAQIPVLHGDLHEVVHVPLALDVGDHGGLHLLTEGRRRLPHETDDAVAVGPVGEHGEVEDHVVPVDGLLDGDAQGGVLPKDQDAVYLRAGVLHVGEVELLAGAEHALALHAPDAGHGEIVVADPGPGVGHGHDGAHEHVLGVGQDLGPLVAQVHLADGELVGVGVLLHGQNLAGDDAGHVLQLLLHALQLEAAPHHALDEFLIGHVEIHIVLQPAPARSRATSCAR